MYANVGVICKNVFTIVALKCFWGQSERKIQLIFFPYDGLHLATPTGLHKRQSSQRAEGDKMATIYTNSGQKRALQMFSRTSTFTDKCI